MASGPSGGAAAATPTVASGIRVDPNVTQAGIDAARANAGKLQPGSHMQMTFTRALDAAQAKVNEKAGNAGTAATKSNPIPAPVADPGTAALPSTTAGTATVTDAPLAPGSVPADPWNVGDAARKRSTIGSMGAAGALGDTSQKLG